MLLTLPCLPPQKTTTTPPRAYTCNPAKIHAAARQTPLLVSIGFFLANNSSVKALVPELRSLLRDCWPELGERAAPNGFLGGGLSACSLQGGKVQLPHQMLPDAIVIDCMAPPDLTMPSVSISASWPSILGFT